MVGTVKVANLGLDKRIFRYTADSWRSYSDQLATYQHSPSKAFDTFRFDVDLPVASGDNEVGGVARLQPLTNNPFTYSELSDRVLRVLYRQRQRRAVGLEWRKEFSLDKPEPASS